MVAPVRAGYDLFAHYAYPPNELGYCGPPGASVEQLAHRAREFDGAWPYLAALGGACGRDPLDAEVVRNYWVGGSLLDSLDPVVLLDRLRRDFAGQATGMLGSVDSALAHHSFHVFVVYPWVRFLGRGDPTTPLHVLQSCRIRWGTVVSVGSEFAEVRSRPLVYDGTLGFADPVVETVRWRKGTSALVSAPEVGETVAAHWDWICGRLDGVDVAVLEERTAQVLESVAAAG
ncbi:MAG TPA: DUF6390 family protein [Mycobacterium sp.]